jgi:hypothetical protein
MPLLISVVTGCWVEQRISLTGARAISLGEKTLSQKTVSP